MRAVLGVEGVLGTAQAVSQIAIGRVESDVRGEVARGSFLVQLSSLHPHEQTAAP